MTIEPGETYKDQWGEEWKVLRGYSPSDACPEPTFLAMRVNGQGQIIIGADGRPRGTVNRLSANLRLATLVLAAALAMPVAAYAQGGWSTYNSPGSSWTSLQGTGDNTGWSGQSWHQDDSSWTSTTLSGPHGETQHCTSYHSSGSSWTNTTCN